MRKRAKDFVLKLLSTRRGVNYHRHNFLALHIELRPTCCMDAKGNLAPRKVSKRLKGPPRNSAASSSVAVFSGGPRMVMRRSAPARVGGSAGGATDAPREDGAMDGAL